MIQIRKSVQQSMIHKPRSGSSNKGKQFKTDTAVENQ